VALAAQKHLDVLDRVEDQLPENAREAITRAREASLNGQKNALRALAQVRAERALEINAASIEERLNRARLKAAENNDTEVDEALADAEELAEVEGEISEIAEKSGKDLTDIEQRIARSTANRLEVLSQVLEKVPEQARPGIERAIENSALKYERAVDKLREKNLLDELPDETLALQRIREQVRERVQVATASRVRNSGDASVSVTVREGTRIEAKNEVGVTTSVGDSSAGEASTTPTLSATYRAGSGSATPSVSLTERASSGNITPSVSATLEVQPVGSAGNQ
jgi:hypothetical protein